MLLLNNDLEILSPDWLEKRVSCFDYPESASSAPSCSTRTEPCDMPASSSASAASPGTGGSTTPRIFRDRKGSLWVRQSMSGITDACLMVPRQALDAIGPLEEERFAIAYNDVDLGLRVIEKDFRVIWTPFACCVHDESASRGSDEASSTTDRATAPPWPICAPSAAPALPGPRAARPVQFLGALQRGRCAGARLDPGLPRQRHRDARVGVARDRPLPSARRARLDGAARTGGPAGRSRGRNAKSLSLSGETVRAKSPASRRAGASAFATTAISTPPRRSTGIGRRWADTANERGNGYRPIVHARLSSGHRARETRSPAQPPTPSPEP